MTDENPPTAGTRGRRRNHQPNQPPPPHRRHATAQARRAKHTMLAVALAVMLTTAGEASERAARTDCETGSVGPDTGWARCTAATDRYRAVVTCVGPGLPAIYRATGPWVENRNLSVAYCRAFHHVAVDRAVVVED